MMLNGSQSHRSLARCVWSFLLSSVLLSGATSCSSSDSGGETSASPSAQSTSGGAEQEVLASDQRFSSERLSEPELKETCESMSELISKSHSVRNAEFDDTGCSVPMDYDAGTYALVSIVSEDLRETQRQKMATLISTASESPTDCELAIEAMPSFPNSYLSDAGNGQDVGGKYCLYENSSNDDASGQLLGMFFDRNTLFITIVKSHDNDSKIENREVNAKLLDEVLPELAKSVKSA